MNAKNLLNKRKKSPYKLDPNSDRYRVCPNDGVKFMAINRREKYCCEKCGEEAYNETQRKKKAGHLDNSSPLEQQQLKKPDLDLTKNVIAQNLPVDLLTNAMKLLDTFKVNVQEKAQRPVPLDLPSDLIVATQPLTPEANNIKLLNSLKINPVEGTNYNMDWMYSIGYNFEIFTGKGHLHNIDPKQQCQFLQMGPYRLFRTEFSQVLIKKII